MPAPIYLRPADAHRAPPPLPPASTPPPGELPCAPWRFSVVIPLRDKGPYVRDAVLSALGQTLPPLEVIVIDNGSTDGGPERLADLLADPRLRLYRQPNHGVSSARNRGVELARGDWVCFLDADDALHPDWLASLVATRARHPQVRAIGARCRPFSGEALPALDGLDAPPAVELIEDLPARWYAGPVFHTSAFAASTRLLRSLQPCFPPGESYGEDLDLFFRVAEQGTLAFIDHALAARRENVPGSLSQAHGRAPAPFLSRMARRAQLPACPPPRRRSMLRFVANNVVDLARHAAASGERGEALRWLFDPLVRARGRRWWLTLLMVLCWPRAAIAAFQRGPLAPAATTRTRFSPARWWPPALRAGRHAGGYPAAAGSPPR